MINKDFNWNLNPLHTSKEFFTFFQQLSTYNFQLTTFNFELSENRENVRNFALYKSLV